MTGCPFWRQPHAWDAVSNSSKYNILAGTQLIQLYKFVYTMSTHIKSKALKIEAHSFQQGLLLEGVYRNLNKFQIKYEY